MKRQIIILLFTSLGLFILSKIISPILRFYFVQLSPSSEPWVGVEANWTDSGISLSSMLEIFAQLSFWIIPFILVCFFVAKMIWRSPNNIGFMRSFLFPVSYLLLSLVLNVIDELTQFHPFDQLLEWLLICTGIATAAIGISAVIAGVTFFIRIKIFSK